MSSWPPWLKDTFSTSSSRQTRIPLCYFCHHLNYAIFITPPFAFFRNRLPSRETLLSPDYQCMRHKINLKLLLQKKKIFHFRKKNFSFQSVKRISRATKMVSRIVIYVKQIINRLNSCYRGEVKKKPIFDDFLIL